jgi:hypothetical protein
MHAPTHDELERGDKTRMNTRHILEEVRVERQRQDARFPDQTLPDGTEAGSFNTHMANFAKRITDEAMERGTLTWADVLKEEFREAMAEEDWAALRTELLQVAAVAVRWIEDGDRRNEVGT